MTLPPTAGPLPLISGRCAGSTAQAMSSAHLLVGAQLSSVQLGRGNRSWELAQAYTPRAGLLASLGRRQASW